LAKDGPQAHEPPRGAFSAVGGHRQPDSPAPRLPAGKTVPALCPGRSHRGRFPGMSKIVWLASYPKSGNTWVRIFLNNYLQNGRTPADINNLEDSMHAGTRELFDRLTGVESSDLTAVEIDRARPWMYRRWAEDSPETLFVKVHDAYRCTDTGQPIFPQEATRTAVYIIRNPLDIAASMANHLSIGLDKAIAYLADEQYGLASSGHKLHRQLPQFMGSWHTHVHSWT